MQLARFMPFDNSPLKRGLEWATSQVQRLDHLQPPGFPFPSTMVVLSLPIRVYGQIDFGLRNDPRMRLFT
ncbi:MAG: hypothetical protein ACRD2U_01050 [Terriglobales bacterium]